MILGGQCEQGIERQRRQSSLGPALIHAIIGRGSIVHVWLYIVGPCIGGAIAAAIFNVQHGAASKKKKA